jgi:glycosyltransferase involved in cell wall biosynthesis
MPVHNAETFLAEAIESILKQSYRNFEFIMIDDASTDNSWKIMKKYAKLDKRIVILQNTKNLGVSQTIACGLKIAKGEYIARMDADDVSIKTRFSKQLKYIKSRPSVVAIGSQCFVIDKDGKDIGNKTFPLTHEEIYDYTFRFNPVQHPTLFISKSRLPKDFEFYDDSLDGAEDLDLLFKLFRYGRVENMDEYLLKYRIHGNNVSFQHVKHIYLQAFLARMKGIFKYSYRPSFTGAVTTFIQTIMMLVLPSSVIFWLYKKLRNIDQKAFATSGDKKDVKVAVVTPSAIQLSHAS